VDFTGFEGIKPSYTEPSTSNYDRLVNRLNNLENAPEGIRKELENLDSVSKDFESLFIYMMMKEMRKTVPETKLLHGGKAEEIFRDMLDEEISKQMSKSPSGGIGIASMIYEQLSRPILERLNQEVPQNIQGTSEPEKK